MTKHDFMKIINELSEDICADPDEYGTPQEVEGAIQILEILKIKIEGM